MTKVPPSCEHCGKVDLLEANIDVWEFVTTYPGVMKNEGLSGALRVDYGSARDLAPESGFENIGELLVKLEAVARGFRNVRK